MSERHGVFIKPLLPIPSFRRAVSKLYDRAEKQLEESKLVASYVDSGMLININNTKNQLIFGRRGTGKTHILKVLAHSLSITKHNAVIYLDMRVLGSSSQFSDVDFPLKERCNFLFKDILLEVYNSVQNHLINLNEKRATGVLEELNHLGQVIARPVMTYMEETLSTRRLRKSSEKDSSSLKLSSAEGLAGGYDVAKDSGAEDEKAASYRVIQEDKILFSDLNESLRRILERSGTTLYLLLDEWSSLPLDIQPYLAEFLKKGFFPNPAACVKIGVIEYRSNFKISKRNRQIIGFERGGDVSVGLDIDRHYVSELGGAFVVDTFAEILYRHIKNELTVEKVIEEAELHAEISTKFQEAAFKFDYLKDGLSIDSAQSLINNLFERRDAFIDLIHSSAGVVRDFMFIFNEAFIYSIKRGHQKIGRQAIFEASVIWFDREKRSNLSKDLDFYLMGIARRVVGKTYEPISKTKAFLVSQRLDTHPVIKKLYDFRVIHRTDIKYVHPKHPDEAFLVYTLDYGCFADSLYTYRFPELRSSSHDAKVIEGGKLTIPSSDMPDDQGLILDEAVLASMKSEFRARSSAAKTSGNRRRGKSTKGTGNLLED